MAYLLGFSSLAIFLLLNVKSVFPQENAGTNVAPGLKECYNNTRMTTPDLRYPSTMTTLINIIRKIEDNNPNMDARELSLQILNRFRQDGIWKSGKDMDTSLGLPFSPKGWEAYKNRLQLTKLTPAANVQPFNNESLNAMERCSLHYMISSTIQRQSRGDEDKTCNQLGRFTFREKRETELAAEPAPTSGTYTHSTCPLEMGVVYTKSGAVKAGLVLAGIAAGLERFNVKTSNGSISADNVFASTLAGELAEVSLQETTIEKTVGNSGGWNSTVLPKYYFVTSNEKDKTVFTDAEMRGALDGLYLGVNMADWKSRSSKLKISQVLELYYSPRGVFNETIRACNRNSLVTTYAPTDILTKQVQYTSYLLDEVSTNPFTPNKDNFPQFAESVVRAFQTAVVNLNDPKCSEDDSYVERTAADVLIFVDSNWKIETIMPLISNILENLDVSRYGSSYTILSGSDGSIIVNKTTSTLDFYENFNETALKSYSGGFDFKQVLQTAEYYFQNKLKNATDMEKGQSEILVMLTQKTPSSEENSFVSTRRVNVLKNYIPDMRIIVGGTGSASSYNSLVFNSQTDIIIIEDTPSDENMKKIATEMTTKLSAISRSLSNPGCAKGGAAQGTNDVYQYVEPRGVNYHKISANYFASGADDRKIKIRGYGYGQVQVCYSRSEITSPGNSTTSKCQNLNSDEIVLNVQNACSGSVSSCSPYYIMVQGLPSTGSSSFKCNDANCLTIDSIKYSVSFERTGCTNSATGLVGLVFGVLVLAISTLLI